MLKVKDSLQLLYEALLFQILKPWLGTSFAYQLSFKPKRAHIGLTERCNSKCITCGLWKGRPTNELTNEEVKGALSQLRELGIRRIAFTGGECTLKKDLAEIIEYTREIGFTEIHINSNGLLLSQEKAIALINSGLNSIQISLDGIGEVHDTIRGVKGSYDKAIDTLKMLVRLRDTTATDLQISIAMTILDLNVDQVLDVFEICKNMNIHFGFNLPTNTLYGYLTADLQNMMEIDREKLDCLVDELHRLTKRHPNILGQSQLIFEYMKRYFDDPRMPEHPCCVGYYVLYIGAHGEVYPQCLALKPLGNLRESSLKEILAHKTYRQQLRDMYFKKCPGCSCYMSLNMLHELSALKEESLWRVGLRRIKKV